MESLLQLYLKKIFPHFSSPLTSRFSGLFYEITKINTNQNKNLKKTDNKNEKQNQNLEKYIINQKKY